MAILPEEDKVWSHYRLKQILEREETRMEIPSTPIAIGSLSRRTGCRVETIRYYERIGLLPHPARSPGGYRLYGRGHLERLGFVRRARALGFSIDDVRTLLGLADHRRRPCAEARRVATAHLADVRAKLAGLRVMERVLKETVTQCGRSNGRHCPLIEALFESRYLVAPRTTAAARRSVPRGMRRAPVGLPVGVE